MSKVGKSGNLGSRSALIVAHPGHELLVHHWIEREKPRVFILTDGSGGAGQKRSRQSLKTIQNAGAERGDVFAEFEDRCWYEDILANDARRFHLVIEKITAACEGGLDQIVCDRVELFNPMHDLANAVAHAVAQRLTLTTSGRPSLITFPIETPAEFPMVETLPASALARKQLAVSNYHALALEAPKYEPLLDRETLIADDAGFSWPANPPSKPYYERFGEQRVRDGRYERLITYERHVRPMALRLLAAGRA